MAPNLPSDTVIAGWLATLGIASRCQWDVLVFLSRHQTTLLGATHLAHLLGYASDVIVVALDGLEAVGLVARSRVSQGARLYQCRVAPGSPRGDALARLQALAADRAGRIRMAQQWQPDRTHGEARHAATRFLAVTQPGRQVARRQAATRTARREQWRKAI